MDDIANAYNEVNGNYASAQQFVFEYRNEHELLLHLKLTYTIHDIVFVLRTLFETENVALRQCPASSDKKRNSLTTLAFQRHQPN